MPTLIRPSAASCLALLYLLFLSPVMARPPLTAVAYDGQSVPGYPSFVRIGNLGTPQISSAGHIGFFAGMQLTPIGYFVTPPGASFQDVQIPFHVGNAPPGFVTPGPKFQGVSAVRLNGRGDLVIGGIATNVGGQFTGDGVWMRDAVGDIQPVALRFGQPPGVPEGVNYWNIENARVTLSESGVAAFGAGLTGPGVDSTNSNAVFSGTPGDVRMVARAGDPAPSLGTDVVLGPIYTPGLAGPRINALGKMTFLSWLAGPGVDPSNNAAMWIGDANGLALAARTGQALAVPGVPDATLANFSGPSPTPTINDAGQIAFPARLAGAGILPGREGAVILADSSGATVIARNGDPAPGMPEGWHMNSGQFAGIRLNGAGQVLFPTTFVNSDSPGQSTQAVVIGTPGNLRQVARVGGPAAGFPEGVTMSSIDLNSMVTNALGQVVFTGAASVPGPSGSSSVFGVWAFDPVTGLFPVALSGDAIEVAPGDTRYFGSAQMYWDLNLGGSGGQDGFRTSLNDNGQLVFRASLYGGDSAIITTTIPTPGVAILLGLSITLAASSRTRVRRPLPPWTEVEYASALHVHHRRTRQ